MRLESSFIQIPGIGQTTERRLWEAGVTDWRGEVDTSPLGPSRAEAVESFAERATPALAADDIEFFAERLPSQAAWRLGESFGPTATAIDIETTGLDKRRSVVTTVSFDGPDGMRTLVRGRDLTRERLQTELRRSELLLSYNGAQFDLPFLSHAFDLSIETPHIDLRFPCEQIGLTGGLSGVEAAIGIDRELPDVDGREAVRLWHAYERGNDAALDRLIRYNREDVRTLHPILEHVSTALDRDRFHPYCP